jgi:hypothetical protein
MKLARIGPAGEEQPAVLADDGTLLATGLGTIRDAVARGDLAPLALSGAGRYGSAVR